jgi:Zn-dependent protease
MIFLIHFGRGKPVQINPMYYKHPLKGELLVSLAGPATNLALAIAGILIMLIYAKITGVTALEMINMPNMVITFRALFAQINIALAIFNLIPIYPLDGYRLVKIIKPEAGFRMEKNGMIITIVFLFLLV